MLISFLIYRSDIGTSPILRKDTITNRMASIIEGTSGQVHKLCAHSTLIVLQQLLTVILKYCPIEKKADWEVEIINHVNLRVLLCEN